MTSTNRMSGYAYTSQYNDAYDSGSERNSQIFWDALSMASGSDRNSIALSIYHSVPELHHEDYESSRYQVYNGNGNRAMERQNWQEYHDSEEDGGGHKLYDFVLAYNPQNEGTSKIKRQIFERNLANEGLVLERDESQKIHFVKVHATKEVLCRYAEILKFKFPIKLDENESEDQAAHNRRVSAERKKSFFEKFYHCFRLNRKLFPEKRYELYHEYSRDKSYLFDVHDPSFFPAFVRISVVNFILERNAFADQPDDNCIGIDKLLSDNVYTAAYPLHDGHHTNADCQRGLLHKEWGLVKNWIKHQPLDTIKNYFGVKVALYFSWLGFYTNMLILPSIFGLIVFIIGLSTMFTNAFVNDICDTKRDDVLCPKCDSCGVIKLSDTCMYERINHILDNNFTVAFAMLMAIWASLYLELWKRYSTTIVHRWGSIEYSKQSEHARPAYLARIKKNKQVKTKTNPVTLQQEPTLSFKFKLPSYMLSYTIIILYILLSIAVVFALIVYRMATLSAKRFFGGEIDDTSSLTYVLWLPASTALINLVVITILNFLYDYLAVFLTDLEYRRTQTEYDNSLSLKIYLFQFINYYSSLFYIAFLKGKWPGTPKKYNKIFGLRQEECPAGGCLMELFIQLSIIMIGKQAINAILENGIPYAKKKYNQFRYGKQNPEDDMSPVSQWVRDYKLMAWDTMGLFQEYLEMVIQYGFCTLFVIAFPLGPLFALFNNIFELRLDAKKFLVFYRRPVPRRQSSIGIWMGVMRVLGKLSIITTAFIIAFSTNFIPRIYYNNAKQFKNVSYVDFIYATFNTEDFETMPDNFNTTEYPICRYPEFRTGNTGDEATSYKRPLHYWIILVYRLAFIIIFQNLVAWIQQAIDWLIPDKPAELDDLMKRESYLVSSKIIREERNRAMQNTSSKLKEIDVVNGGVFYEAKS